MRDLREPFTPMPRTATWKRKVSNDGLKNTWSEEPIACTFRQKRSRVADVRGNYVASSAIIRTTEDIQPDDVIIYGGRAWPVKAIDDVHDINNTGLERIVYL